MNTRERVAGMLDDLTDEQLEAIAVILSGMAAKSSLRKTAADKMKAFEALESLRRPMRINEQDELDAWRKEKYGL